MATRDLEQLNIHSSRDIIARHGLTLPELFELSLEFYREEKHQFHLSYEQKNQLAAYWRQTTLGPYNPAKLNPGYFDIVGNDRKKAWEALGEISANGAMAGFCNLVETVCPDLVPWIRHKKRARDNAEKAEKAKEAAARQKTEIEEKEASRLINIVKRAEQEAKHLQDSAVEEESTDEDETLPALENNDRSVCNIPPPVLPIATKGQPSSNGNTTTSNGQQTRENGVSVLVEPTPCPDLILPDTKSQTDPAESESQKLEGDVVVKEIESDVFTQNCEDSGVVTSQATDCSPDTCEISTEQSSLESTSSITEEKSQMERAEDSGIPSTVEGKSRVVVEQSEKSSGEVLQPTTDASLAEEQVIPQSDPSTTKSVVSSQSGQLTSDPGHTHVTSAEQHIAVESVLSLGDVVVAVDQQGTTEIVAVEQQNAVEKIAATVNPVSTVEPVPEHTIEANQEETAVVQQEQQDTVTAVESVEDVVVAVDQQETTEIVAVEQQNAAEKLAATVNPISTVEPVPEHTIEANQDETAVVQQEQQVTAEPDVQLNAVLAQHFACILYLQKLKDTGHQLTDEQENYLGQMSAYESQLRTFQSNQETSTTEGLQAESEPTVEVSDQEQDINLQESAEMVVPVSAAIAPELPEGMETAKTHPHLTADSSVKGSEAENVSSESEQDPSTVQSESSIELSDTQRLSTTDSLEAVSPARHSQESFSMVASTESLQHVKLEEAAKPEESLQQPEEAAKSEESLQIVPSISADSSQMGSDLAVPDSVAEAIADESPALLEPALLEPEGEEEEESAVEGEEEEVVGDIPADVEGSLAAATEDSDLVQIASRREVDVNTKLPRDLEMVGSPEPFSPVSVGSEDPAEIWTRAGVQVFVSEVSSDPESVLHVGRGETVTVRIPTYESGTALYWEFATEGYDIGFGASFEWEEEEGATDEILVRREPILPILRRSSHEKVITGSHAFPRSGTYLLLFDNSYSLLRSKTVYYRVFYTR